MAPFQDGQIVTVFRSRIRPESADDYHALAPQILALAQTMPGLIDVKSFVADDGERVTLATFADEPSQEAWRLQADHRAAQQRGRAEFYQEFSLQICRTIRTTLFPAPAPAPAPPNPPNATAL